MTNPVSPEVPSEVAVPAPAQDMPSENVLLTGALLEYLKTDKGHETAKGVIDFFRDWRCQSVSIGKHSLTLSAVTQLITLVVVLGVALYVTVNGKMEPVIASLLGTLAGYALGRRTS